MLVITRKEAQSFFIGKDIQVVVLNAKGQVKIGIEAPQSVPILRDNIIKKIAMREAKEKTEKENS